MGLGNRADGSKNVFQRKVLDQATGLKIRIFQKYCERSGLVDWKKLVRLSTFIE